MFAKTPLHGEPQVLKLKLKPGKSKYGNALKIMDRFWPLFGKKKLKESLSGFCQVM